MSTTLSYALWAVIALIALVWLPFVALVFAVTAPFDAGRYAAGRTFRRAGIAVGALIPVWEFRVTGVRITDPRRPYVAVANHESYVDVFLISHVPWEMKWLSKEAIFRIPVMGWMMRMAGDIEVRRGDRRSRAEALEQIRDRLRKRVSVMILPEGTRSPDGQLLPFKDGAFRVAVEMGLPILPIAVAGTRHAMAKDSFAIRRARAIAHVLPPIETTGLTRDDVPALRDRVREMIGQARESLLRQLGEDA